MLLSATLPPQLESEVAACMHLRKPYKRVLTSLDRPNIFYEVKKKQSLEIDLRHLLSCLQLSESPDEVPETLIFVFSKKACYKIYCYLWQKVNERKRSLFAQFHASMSDEGKAYNARKFLLGDIRIMVATTAFGMGIDVPDIRLVLLYECPREGIMYCQLSGRAGRQPGTASVCKLLYSVAEEKLPMGTCDWFAPANSAFEKS